MNYPRALAFVLVFTGQFYSFGQTAKEIPTLCGVYTAQTGLFKKLEFIDTKEVKLQNQYTRVKAPYWLLENTLYIELATGMLKLHLENGETLIGKNGIVSNTRFSKASQEKCEALVLNEEEYEEHLLEITYLKGEMAQKSNLKGLATMFWKEACEKGHAKSCYRLGLLKAQEDRELAKEAFQKSCEGGYGEACAELARLEEKAGNKEMAQQLYQKACEYGYTVACMVQYLNSTKESNAKK
ncbi:hypothetical protein AAG747_13865 [Rapidithrix thailandica]|uniref:Beta-lactamase n=1 Tax=Rapidithrix thailandica TaxID=413964 RepID=A0AAW9SB64_9BACT